VLHCAPTVPLRLLFSTWEDAVKKKLNLNKKVLKDLSTRVMEIDRKGVAVGGGAEPCHTNTQGCCSRAEPTCPDALQ
jgi:hypothetical protein